MAPKSADDYLRDLTVMGLRHVLRNMRGIKVPERTKKGSTLKKPNVVELAMAWDRAHSDEADDAYQAAKRVCVLPNYGRPEKAAKPSKKPKKSQDQLKETASTANEDEPVGDEESRRIMKRCKVTVRTPLVDGKPGELLRKRLIEREHGRCRRRFRSIGSLQPNEHEIISRLLTIRE